MNTLVNPHSFRQILVVAYFGVNALVSHTMSGQLAPSGAIHVQQPNGVHYIFGTGGTHTGGGFFYVNYLTGQYDVIGPVSVSANGSFFGSSGLTGLSVSGQVYSTSITLTYNGTTVSSNKESLYGPSGAFAGNFLGPWTESSLGVGSGILANSSDGTSLLVSLSNNGVNIGVGSIDSGGHIYITSLAGESISTTFAPVNGIAQGTASSSFGYQYTYSATKAVPPRLANISTRGFIGSGEQVLIGGFIVKDGGKTVLLNAKGPSLAAQGVANPIQNPKLDLYLGPNIVASNLNWRTNANAAEITASGAGPKDDREASLQVGLEPGAYTVVVSSEDGSQGIGLVEAFGIE